MEETTTLLNQKLSRMILQLHRGWQGHDIKTFRNWALNQIKPLVYFDNVLWWTGIKPGLVIHDRHWYTPPGGLEMNHTRLRFERRLLALALRTPDRTLNMDATALRALFAARKEHYLQCRRLSIEHALCAAHHNPYTSFMSAILMYRTDASYPFHDGERVLAEFLFPHLIETYRNNSFHQRLRLQENDVTHVTALCDHQGVVHYAEPGFEILLQAEWPEWRGPHLPYTLQTRLNGTRSKVFQGRKLHVTLSPMNDVVYLKIQPKSKPAALNPQQHAIIKYMTQGMTYKEIARNLGVAPSTVTNHVQNIYKNSASPTKRNWSAC